MSLRKRVPWLLTCALLAGCAKQAPLAPKSSATSEPAIPKIETAELDRLEQLAARPDRGVALLSARSRQVIVPAGSVDDIQAAIHAAGDGGVVILRSGVHTEHATVVVDRRVSIRGEAGARVLSSAGGLQTGVPMPILPVFHVVSSGAAIQGLEIAPVDGDGNCAVLIDGADDVLVFKNRMLRFQIGVDVEFGDRARIWSNTLVSTEAWQSGAVADAYGILVTNGDRASVLRNHASGFVFGIWACDTRGTVAFNSAHHCFVGIILCRVPTGSWLLPGGRVVGAARSGTQWTAAFNRTFDNLTTGLLAVDGATRNLIASNESTGNGTYDVELAGDSFRFGFLTPTTFENTFIAGAFPNTEVKNCGSNNQVFGGQLVDNSVEPCD